MLDVCEELTLTVRRPDTDRYGRMTEHEESDYGDEFKVP